MNLLTIVYVSDMERSLAFYRAFCDRVESQSRMWTELTIGDAHLALHYADPLLGGGRVDLAFLSAAPLEQIVAQLKAQGIPLECEISDEAFGRSFMVRDPDGLLIQINEHDPDYS